MKAEFLTALLTGARGEVVAWQFNLLTFEEGCQLLVEQWQVQSMQVLEVVIALLVAWRLVAVEEIVIERDADGFNAVDGKLYAETLAGRGLS